MGVAEDCKVLRPEQKQTAALWERFHFRFPSASIPTGLPSAAILAPAACLRARTRLGAEGPPSTAHHFRGAPEEPSYQQQPSPRHHGPTLSPVPPVSHRLLSTMSLQQGGEIRENPVVVKHD
ncbi:hypothetical protein AAFF_G00345090 [Aldrovandia affinis]|uniref:Uncharacterized protein n=1 Tax=Aldrovandia affinis TaxID=143900 RepID=A0AAD7R5R7_9TELE|nr:hypothetical protein AAFF_G00345090 [Aldrovandia affinis]